LSQANTSSQPAPPEQRKAPRKKVLLTGKVIFGGGAQVFDCTIRDISATGARITLAQGRTIPDAVHLLDLGNRVAYEATVVARRSVGFGLRFAKTMKLTDVPPELRYLKRIWMDCAR
jgi:hypothetical protein